MAKLGEQAVGSIVKLNLDGTAWEFLVVHQGLPGTMYDVSCDGTWLLMKKIYKDQAWDAGNSNDYAQSDIHAYLNGTFLDLFDVGVRNVIPQVKIPYTKDNDQGTVATGADGLPTKVFFLSYTEIGFTGTGTTSGWVEGAVLEYFDGASSGKRVAYLDGTAAEWRTRSPLKNNTRQVLNVSTKGETSYAYARYWYGVRPALILPYDLAVSDDGFVDGSLAKFKGIAGQVYINSVPHSLTGEGYIKINGVLCPLVDSCANITGVLRSLNGVSKDVSGLPTGYTQVEFISATGTQYIDTGLTVNKTDSYEYILTAYFTNDAWGGANAYMQFNSEYSTNKLTEFRIVYNGTTCVENIYVDNSLHTTFNWASSGRVNVKIGIFKLGDDNNTWHTLESQIGKVYSCQIYKSGTLVRDFVPCTNSSGVAGLYDLVNGAFYTNAGTGTFGVGT